MLIAFYLVYDRPTKAAGVCGETSRKLSYDDCLFFGGEQSFVACQSTIVVFSSIEEFFNR